MNQGWREIRDRETRRRRERAREIMTGLGDIALLASLVALGWTLLVLLSA